MNRKTFLFTLGLFVYATTGHAAECRKVIERPGVSLVQCARLKVLRLEGTPVERQRNLGSLLGKELNFGPVKYFANKLLDPARNRPKIVSWFIEKVANTWVRVLHRSTPKDLAEELDAFAEGAGLSPIEVKRAISLPDVAAFLVKWTASPWLSWLPVNGCTSVAKRFASGGFVYGRNLDFAGAEIWDRYPLVTIHVPAPGAHELKHIAFGADGAGFAGITGINEAGITFAVHQNYSLAARTGGTPMFLIGDSVLRHARNLDEAVSELKRLRPSPLWTFVLTDLKSGRALAVETSQLAFAVREMRDDRFVQTNHIQSEEHLPFEQISIGTKYNSKFRFNFAMDKLAQLKEEKNGIEKIAAILAHQNNPSGDLTGYHDVLKAHTIQTILFQQKNGIIEIGVAIGDAPTASGEFAFFRATDLWDFTGEQLKFRIESPAKPEYKVREKQKAISRAFAKYFDEHDNQAAIAEVANQESLDAKLFVAAALYGASDYERAAKTATEALANPRFLQEPKHIRDSLKRVELLSLWRLGHMEQAIAGAQDVLASTAAARPSLQNLAKALVKSGKPSFKQKHLNFEFFSGDLGGIVDP
jgi:hypothetical protein